jgi:hypothetical protein
MSGTPNGSCPVRWIVQGTGVSSGRLAERIRWDPEITEGRRIASDVVVLLMSPQKARELRNEFAEQLVIELDADLGVKHANGGR